MYDKDKPSGFNGLPAGFVFFDDDVETIPEALFIGIDWARGYGHCRGEILKREGNVVHVRFKTEGLTND